jgi:poly(3-hydroxyalkanoate) synthetase
VNLTLKPFSTILINVIDELMARDVSEIFCEPVDTNQVVDYLNVIKKPMDLSTMKEKVNSFEYLNIDDMQKDFDLMIRNCLMYNGKDTIYYKAGLRLRELGGVVFRQARRLINSIGFDKVTGLHLENRVSELPVLEDSQILEKGKK